MSTDSEQTDQAVTPGPTGESADSVADSDEITASGSLEEQTWQGLEHILSIHVPVIVRLAERKMSLQEVLRFSLGSVIQFEKNAYEHVDLMINNSVLGLGQPVKIGENFGLRIVQIGDISETIKSLGGNGDAAESAGPS